MPPNEQYQHYIPQFILRNFSHPYRPAERNGSQKKTSAGRAKPIRRADKVLKIVDLVSDEPQLRETPVSRWFGQVNMYNDAADAISSKKSVEEELSKLESRTAEILQKVKKAHENGEPGIILNRTERDRLRKFLFIMKYRGPGFYGKYASGDLSMYKWEDKNLLDCYMAEKGFESPRDVWLHNLRAILEVEMGAERQWMKKLPEVMFPPDAAMFAHHVGSSYTAFCTPSEVDDEFVLTDQCYNVMEGPICETRSVTTGEDLGPTYQCFHEFGPISPRLIIVLRSSLLPEALEDANPRIMNTRESWREAAATLFPNPESTNSILADLPVAKAMNSYVRVANGRLELAPGETGRPRSSDKFTFSFWPIKRKHVDIINSIFLDNVLHCQSIVFHSKPSFTRTLEAYMTSSSYGFKNLGVGEHRARTTRRACLEKLSVVLRSLGSDKTPVWHDNKGAAKPLCMRSLDDEWLGIVKKLFGRGMEFATGDFWDIYCKSGMKSLKSLDSDHALGLLTSSLCQGGTKAAFLTDLEQSWRLYQLQALVFNSSLNFDDRVGYKMRTEVLELILRFHPRRIWLYVKHARWMFSDEYARHQKFYIGTPPIFAAKTEALLRPEIEDKVVKGQSVPYIVVSPPNWNSTLMPRLRDPRSQSGAFIAPNLRSRSTQRLSLGVSHARWKLEARRGKAGLLLRAVDCIPG
jgi:hypothetical protein